MRESFGYIVSIATRIIETPRNKDGECQSTEVKKVQFSVHYFWLSRLHLPFLQKEYIYQRFVSSCRQGMLMSLAFRSRK